MDGIEDLIKKRNELNELIAAQAFDQIDASFKSIKAVIDGSENLVLDKEQKKAIKKYTADINSWIGVQNSKTSSGPKLSLTSKQKSQIESKMTQENHISAKSAVGKKAVLKLVGVESEVTDEDWDSLEKEYGLVRKEGRGPAAYWCRKKK